MKDIAHALLVDLAKAGIERVDGLGRKLDFHALRYTFATNLARSGAAQRLAQELMRHSDPKLTAKVYTDAKLLPTFETVEQLPWMAAAEARSSDSEAVRKDSQIDPQNPDFSGPFPSRSVKTNHGLEIVEPAEGEVDGHALTRPVTRQKSTPPGTRTPNQLIKSQV
ncbi:MAG: tyrosine-type recombinase/integrase [Opitutales bacterium]